LPLCWSFFWSFLGASSCIPLPITHFFHFFPRSFLYHFYTPLSLCPPARSNDPCLRVLFLTSLDFSIFLPSLSMGSTLCVFLAQICPPRTCRLVLGFFRYSRRLSQVCPYANFFLIFLVSVVPSSQVSPPSGSFRWSLDFLLVDLLVSLVFTFPFPRAGTITFLFKRFFFPEFLDDLPSRRMGTPSAFCCTILPLCSLSGLGQLLIFPFSLFF